MVGKHLEKGIVAAGATYVVNIIETDAGLGDGQWIVGWFDHTIQHPRLEVVYGRLNKEYIVTPSGNNGVAAYPAVAVLFEKTEVFFPHLVVSIWPLDG
jgi:hypothetical protein